MKEKKKNTVLHSLYLVVNYSQKKVIRRHVLVRTEFLQGKIYRNHYTATVHAPISFL